MNIGLIVDDDTSLTDGDQVLHSVLDSVHTVTLIDSSAAQVSPGTYDVVVVGATCQSADMAGKYGPGWAGPVVVFNERSALAIDMGIIETGGGTSNRQASSSVTITSAGEDITGLSGSVQISTESDFGSLRDVASNFIDRGTPTVVGTHPANTRAFALAWAAGVQMNDTANTLAGGRRVWVCINNAAFDDGGSQGLTSDGETMVLSAVAWALTQEIAATLLSATTTFGSHTVTDLTQEIAATLLSATTTFGSHTVTPGALPIGLAAIEIDPALPSPTVHNTQIVRARRLTSTTTFGSHTVDLTQRRFRFTPPTFTQAYDPRTDPRSSPAVRAIGRWFVRHEVGIAVLRFGDAFVERHLPTTAEIAAADGYWQGGMSHEVTEEEAQALLDAGYGSNVEEVPVL